jgi:hypothetical protein
MSARSLIALETGATESAHLRNAQEISEFHTMLRFIIDTSTEKLKAELAQEIDSFAGRAERQLLLFKQSQLVDFLMREIETAYMTMEDGMTRAVFYTGREQRAAA